MEKNKEMKREMEVRTLTGGLYQPRLREETGGEGAESRTIEGYAIVFGVESKLLMDWRDVYREVIEPGAIDEARLKTMDIKMTMFHQRTMLLARQKSDGTGTLKLTVDEKGVKYEFEAPHTIDGDKVLELVKRGDLGGSSFTFWSDEKISVSYTKSSADGELVRHVNRLDLVTEMTVAADPAYNQTSVNAREVLDGLEPEKKEKTDDKAGKGAEAIKRVREMARW
ncbi:MAG: HK97 family phage prohead protease [Bacteroidaceae bacterium]|nr:HK97 family phage prohead protease [Bacteroidaceae bacterium]